MLSLSLVPGKKWMEAPAPEGNTIFLVELKVQGSNVLEGASDVAMIIPTPSVVESDQLIYIKATRQFAINGTHFRNKKTELIFEPPLVRNQDYILNVASTKTLVLTRTTGHQWRGDPGPLKLRRIDTGGGQLRVSRPFCPPTFSSHCGIIILKMKLYKTGECRWRWNSGG